MWNLKPRVRLSVACVRRWIQKLEKMTRYNGHYTRLDSWAGLHDNVPDRPSVKVAPIMCQLATVALTIKTVTIPNGGLHGRSCHPMWGVSASFWTVLHETGGLSTRLTVHRLGRCRVTQPWCSTCTKTRRRRKRIMWISTYKLQFGNRLTSTVEWQISMFLA